MQAQPARPVIDTQALADLTHDSEKTSIVLEVVSQTKPGSEMHLHANWVAISLITTLQTIYRDIDDFNIDPEFLTCVYSPSAKGYVMTIPSMLRPILDMYPALEAPVEGGNTISLLAKDYSASDKAKVGANSMCFGIVKGPVGACITDSDMSETVADAIRSTHMQMTKCHAVKNEFGMRKDHHAFHFEMPPLNTGPSPFLEFPKLKKDPPRTKDGYPLDISFSKAFCSHFQICNKCLKTNSENEGSCVCRRDAPRGLSNSKKHNREEAFQRMMAKMQRR